MSSSAVACLLTYFGPEVEDPEEETFVLFAHDRPDAQNLGFIDPSASVVEVTVAGRDLTVHQAPAVLTSQRAGGTTGAVLWKITPYVAEWLARPDNVFFSGAGGSGSGSVLGSHAAILELGCGISGLIGLTLTRGGRSTGTSTSTDNTTNTVRRKGNRQKRGPLPSEGTNTVARYVLSDQPYVARLVQRNLEENNGQVDTAGSGNNGRGRRGTRTPESAVYFHPLDWETDQVTAHLLALHDSNTAFASSFDAVIACDCIYNEALIPPLVQTCADACRLRQQQRTDVSASAPTGPTVCIVAQQLRDPDVFTAWLTAFHAMFRVWRVPWAFLTSDLQPSAGFSVHVGILREEQL